MRLPWLPHCLANTACGWQKWPGPLISSALIWTPLIYHKPFRKENFRGKHRVQHTYSYLSAITDQSIPVPPVLIFLTPEEQQAEQRLQKLLPPVGQVCAIHISSRSSKRHWSVERYAELSIVWVPLLIPAC